MILADKIIKLRKKNGWSQEELAARMNVSRQAVSKWEAAQTTPDLEKILLMGRLFGVTTDYLLKDEMENEEFTSDSSDSICRQVTMEQANQYLSLRKWAAGRIALAVALCILSPICLFMLGAVTELPDSKMSEGFLVYCGLAILFVLIAVAVALFIYVGSKNSPYEYLDKESFELAYGVAGMVREKQKAFRDTYVKGNIAGTCLCIVAPVVLLLGVFTVNTVVAAGCLCGMLAIIAVAVGLFITVGVQWASMERLLREGEFTPKDKTNSKLSDTISTVYWLLATAIYLGWSFASNNWGITWILWPIAGIVHAAVMAIVNLFSEKEKK